jgi:hypothetical protein
MFWRVPRLVKSEAPNVQELRDQANSVQKRIRHIMNVAMWLAGTGVLALGACLALTTFDQHVPVLISVSDPGNYRFVCPNFVQAFPSQIARSDLSGTSTEIPVSLAARDCGSVGDVVVYIPRSSSAFTFEAKH